MKNYLVAYDVGIQVSIVETTCVQVEDGYIPFSDNMETIKEKVIEKEHPERVEIYPNPNGYLGIVKRNKYTKDTLKIISISELG